jgi:hypothetical protein
VLVTLPLAAAAIVAVARARTRAHVDVVATRSRATMPVQSSRRVTVDVARGQHATVMNTVDPSVTVIWITPGDAP